MVRPKPATASGYYRRLADQIMSTEKTMALNQTTFHELAVADAPYILPAPPTSAATQFRAVFVCTSRGSRVRTCKMARDIFFFSPHSEHELEQLLRATETNARIIQSNR